MHPQIVDVASALIQRKAIHHLGRIAAVQQLLGGQSGGLGVGRVAQIAQQAGHGRLHRRIERAGHTEIEAVQIVKTQQTTVAKQAGKMRAHRIGCLLCDERNRCGRHLVDTPVQLRLERRIAQRGRNYPCTAQQA